MESLFSLQDHRSPNFIGSLSTTKFSQIKTKSIVRDHFRYYGMKIQVAKLHEVVFSGKFRFLSTVFLHEQTVPQRPIFEVSAAPSRLLLSEIFVSPSFPFHGSIAPFPFNGFSMNKSFPYTDEKKKETFSLPQRFDNN